MSTDWMPRRRDEQLAMARTWLVQLPQSGGAWTINAGHTASLNALVNAAQAAMDALESGTAGSVDTARAREAFAALTGYMRFLHRRTFFTPPMLDSDWIRLGLRPRDLVRTEHVEVAEVVEFELKLRNVREILVNFWVKGAAHKAKPSGYDGAVIIWDVLDAPPPEPDHLTRHTMASRTPHALEFTEEERGGTVYIAAAWQNERGNIGAWSVIQSAVIP